MEEKEHKQKHPAAAMEINENTAGAEGLIRDTNMAEKLMGLITDSILAETGMFILAQANVSIEGVTCLLFCGI